MPASTSSSRFRVPFLLALLLAVLIWAREDESRGSTANVVRAAHGVEGRSVDRGRLVISPDGRTVALAGHDHSVQVWRDGALRRVLPGSEVYLGSDEWVLTRGSSAGVLGIEVWAVEGSEPGRRLAADRAVRHLAVTADGRHVLGATAKGRIETYDIESGERLWELPEDRSRQRIQGLEALPDGKVAVFTPQELQVWSPESGLHCTAAISWQYYTWEGNGSGTALLYEARDRRFAAWDLEACREILEIEGFTARSSAALDGEGRYLALGGEETRGRVWDLATGETIPMPALEAEPITALRFHPTRHALVVVDTTGELTLHPLDGGEVQRLGPENRRRNHRFRLAALSSQGDRALGTDQGGKIVVLDLERGERLYEMAESHRKILGLAWSKDSRTLFAGTQFKGLTAFGLSSGGVSSHRDSASNWMSLELFEVGDGRERMARMSTRRSVLLSRVGEELPYAELSTARDVSAGRSGGIKAFAVDPGTGRIATASQEGWVFLWEGAHGRQLFELENPAGGLRTLAFSPDGRHLLGRGWSGRVVIWRLDWRVLTEVLEPLSAWPNLLLPLEDGYRLNLQERPFWKRWNRRADLGFLLPLLPFHRVGEGEDEEILWLDGNKRLAISDRDLRAVWSAEEPASVALSFAVSPGGDRVAVGTLEPSVDVFDRRSRTLLERLPGHRAGIRALAWSPDGKFLASGDEHGTVWIRDGKDYRLLARLFLDCRKGWVLATPDGRWDADPSRCSGQPLGIRTTGGLIEPLTFSAADHEPGLWRELGTL